MNALKLALAVAALSLCQTAWAQYTIEYFSRPGFERTWFFDVNNSGTIVGYSSNLDGTESQGFVFESGVYTSLIAPFGATGFVATGITETGIIVGHTLAETLAGRRGFVFENGIHTPFQVPGGEGTDIRGVSPNGRWLSGAYYEDGALARGYVYDRTTGEFDFTQQPGDFYTTMQGVNNAGVAVGSTLIRGPGCPPVCSTSFLFDAASNTRENFTIPGLETRARAINEIGLIGGFLAGAGSTQTTLFYGAMGNFSLLDLSGDGRLAVFVQGIDDANALVGAATFPDGSYQGFLATPIPEPAACMLMLGGLVVLSAASAVRRRSG